MSLRNEVKKNEMKLRKRSYEMEDFVFITLKILILEFRFWKIIGGEANTPLTPLSSPIATALLRSVP